MKPEKQADNKSSLLKSTAKHKDRIVKQKDSGGQEEASSECK